MSRDAILIVDDEEGVQTSLQGILEDVGLEAQGVGSGEEGLALMARKDFAVVLLDIWLPGMDGLQILEKIREMAPATMVVMISGHGSIETAVRATKLGAFDFIEKPLSLEKTLV
ncbi:MAG: response regulator, partial [Acidobacteriota bacterium]